MNIDELIIILSNKLAALNAQKTHYMQVGELEQAMELDKQIVETELTLKKLKLIA